MATEYVDFEGIAEWPKLFEFNRDKPEWSKETDGEYTLRVIVDAETQAKLKASGTQKKFNTDPEGRGMVYAPTRPHKARQDWQGGPPKVFGPDARPWNTEEDGLIGNGSRVRVRVSVYDAGGGRKGTRLEAVQVIEHVPYISEGGDSGNFYGFAKPVDNGFAKAVEDSKPKAKAPEPKSTESLEDEIPW